MRGGANFICDRFPVAVIFGDKRALARFRRDGADLIRDLFPRPCYYALNVI